MMSTRIGVVVVAVVLLVACGGEQPPAVQDSASTEAADVAGAGWTRVSAEALDAGQQALEERILAARQAMAERLMGELQEALDTTGAPGAIEVCSIRAPEIAAAVSNEYGLLVGRTSFRLRNVANRPPDWAEAAVAERVADPQYFVGPDGQLAALMPITMQEQCTMCHGSADAIPEDVEATLADIYPDDQAVGFAPGDLRGWFWIETPTS